MRHKNKRINKPKRREQCVSVYFDLHKDIIRCLFAVKSVYYININCNTNPTLKPANGARRQDAELAA